MDREEKKLSWLSWTIVGVLFSLLAYGGYLSYKSIDFDVLKKLEAQKLVLPSPQPTASQLGRQVQPTVVVKK